MQDPIRKINKDDEGWRDACSIYSYTYTHPSYTGRPHSHHYMCTNRTTTTLKTEDRVLLKITEIAEDSVGDGRVTFPLCLHVWEAAYLFIGANPGETWTVKPGTRMLVGWGRLAAPNHWAIRLFSPIHSTCLTLGTKIKGVNKWQPPYPMMPPTNTHPLTP